jgi:CheY-like chemotaxis protein
MEKLSILVCEDNIKNLQAAREQLAEHIVHTASTLVGAIGFLGSRMLEDIPSYGDKFEWAGLPIPQYKGDIDIVLTDMYLPGGRVRGLYEFGDDQPTPVGVMIALRAASLGVKRIGLMSNANHHTDAMTCGIDMLNGTWFSTKRPLNINGSKVVFTTAKMVSTEGSYVKDWQALLEGLLAE